jgi:hypothetical protein
MKAIIEGKTYNTETADRICTLPCSAEGSGDFRYHDTDLYRTPKGTFFIAGVGGPMTMWARSVGNGTSGGSGVRLVSADEARKIMEQADCDEDDFKNAGLAVEEG